MGLVSGITRMEEIFFGNVNNEGGWVHKTDLITWAEMKPFLRLDSVLVA